VALRERSCSESGALIETPGVQILVYIGETDIRQIPCSTIFGIFFTRIAVCPNIGPDPEYPDSRTLQIGKAPNLKYYPENR